MEPDEPLPEEYGFLTEKAKENYRTEGRPIPRAWTVEQLFRGYLSREELLLALEDHFREEIVELKEGAGSRIQLGLDLRGGMRVLIRADLVPALPWRTGRRVRRHRRRDHRRRRCRCQCRSHRLTTDP